MQGCRCSYWAFGSPAQIEDVEVGIPDDPLDVANMTHAERRAMQARIVREHPELAVLVPKRRPDGSSVRNTHGS